MNPEHVPVVVVGAGPTGVTAATLLAQYGISTLILDRWPGPYPQPRTVHIDDEVLRIVARLGLADEFAAISRPALGLRLIGRGGRVLAEFSRPTALSVHGFPQANMFDQPEFETLLRANLAHYPAARLRGSAEVTDIAQEPRGRTRVTFTDRADGAEHTLTADYVLGCDGANSIVRSRIGVGMKNLRFEQRWPPTAARPHCAAPPSLQVCGTHTGWQARRARMLCCPTETVSMPNSARVSR